jgi:TPR repeat protein
MNQKPLHSIWKRAARTAVAVAITAFVACPGASTLAGSQPPGAPASRATAVVTVTTLESLVAAAYGGDVEAMNSLGVLYAMGTQLPHDYPTALLWFQKAIDGGSSNAMGNLGTMYLLGIGVPRDLPNAFRWFERSAAHGNVQSAYSAAVMADEGLGTARDARLARTLYRRAAEFGSAVAMIRLSDDCARSGSRRDLVDAYAWMLVAAQVTVPAELQMTVVARLEKLGARIAPERRDDARELATRRLAIVRAHAASGDDGAASDTSVPLARVQFRRR